MLVLANPYMDLAPGRPGRWEMGLIHGLAAASAPCWPPATRGSINPYHPRGREKGVGVKSG